MSWIILEGPDDVGKTTIARNLERNGFLYQHCDANDTLPVLARRMAVLVKEPYVVWDRCHLGEMVHHPERVDPAWVLLIETLLVTLEAKCYLLTVRRGEPETWENSLSVHNELTNSFVMVAAFSFRFWTDEILTTPLPYAEPDLKDLSV